MKRVTGRAGTVALITAAALIAGNLPAAAESPFANLAGTWSGQGKVRLEGGKSEAIRCKAYYTTSDGGSGLGMAIRCASAANKIEMRANLSYANGSVSGSWEERTYNAAGQVTGQASSSKLTLKIQGGGLDGNMSVRLGGASQSVSISTTGSTFQGLDLSLSRG
ncbi:MAG: hypothetical protein H6876_11805 [Hyphomicrobiaceae bacterium]|nr:hypothetical protein [Hyphomicrobiaceae bacterium]MCC0008790.1 hypothetical protein [Hyphomicrobiaceae bacterium]